MLFNSWQFAVFFPVVFFLYYLIPHRYRWSMLLAVSYYFYMCWEVDLVALILIETVVHYFSALGIERMSGRSNWGRRLLLVGSVSVSLGILFFYKYFNFFALNRVILHNFSIPLNQLYLTLFFQWVYHSILFRH